MVKGRLVFVSIICRQFTWDLALCLQFWHGYIAEDEQFEADKAQVVKEIDALPGN